MTAPRAAAPAWMADAVKLNPPYTLWGPGQDYMRHGNGWDESVRFDWSDRPDLDNWNEVVHFHFKIRGAGGDLGEDNSAPSSLVLTVWMLHPRKSAARGAEIVVEKADLPAVLAWLAYAAKRNADRFAKVVAAAGGTP